MTRSLSQKQTLSMIAIHGTLVVVSILFLAPLLWMVSTSLKKLEQVMSNPPVWIPSPIEWGNYGDAVMAGAKSLDYIPFVVYAVNTIALCALVVAGTTISNAVVGYSFARLRWPGRDLCFSIVLATLMVPFPVLMVPTFGLMKELGWVGSFRPLWVPAFFASAFSIYLLRQFFRTIPMELSEAAKLDGCSEWGIFAKVVAPLCRPALAVVALFSFIGTWNDFLGPLIYLQSQKTFTLSLGLQQFQSQHGGASWNQMMAASVIVVAPIIILFFFTQRLFIQGIAVTGLKG